MSYLPFFFQKKRRNKNRRRRPMKNSNCLEACPRLGLLKARPTSRANPHPGQLLILVHIHTHHSSKCRVYIIGCGYLSRHFYIYIYIYMYVCVHICTIHTNLQGHLKLVMLKGAKRPLKALIDWTRGPSRPRGPRFFSRRGCSRTC